jgi:hypothetical protein
LSGKKRSWLVIRYRLEAYATSHLGLITAGTRKCAAKVQHSIQPVPMANAFHGWTLRLVRARSKLSM